MSKYEMKVETNNTYKQWIYPVTRAHRWNKWKTNPWCRETHAFIISILTRRWVKFPLLINKLSGDSQYQQNRNFNFNRRHLVEF